jgi:hypothetical protein
VEYGRSRFDSNKNTPVALHPKLKLRLYTFVPSIALAVAFVTKKGIVLIGHGVVSECDESELKENMKHLQESFKTDSMSRSQVYFEALVADVLQHIRHDSQRVFSTGPGALAGGEK